MYFKLCIVSLLRPVSASLFLFLSPSSLSLVQGDSGSGLMCVNHLGQWSVEGIMSSGGAQCGVPSPRALRFTSVNATFPWIRQTMFTYG